MDGSPAFAFAQSLSLDWPVATGGNRMWQGLYKQSVLSLVVTGKIQ